MKEKGVTTAVMAAVIVVIVAVAGVGAYFMLKGPGGGEAAFEWFQTGNTQPITQLQTKRSQELEDTHISASLGTYYPEGWDNYNDPELVYSLGFKRIHISFDDHLGDPLDWQRVEVEPGGYSIDPAVDNVISDYASNGITIVLSLNVGNEENCHDITRFRSDNNVERYCNYVRFMVNHFKGRIKYYEIWNEPGPDTECYINLVKHVVPVIQEEDPEAKIVIGALSGEWITGYPGYEFERYSITADYVEEFLGSDVAPTIDAISWHPFYCTRPDDPYYQNYPQMVEDIKEFAASQGFNGEYLADEIMWKTYREEGELGGAVSSEHIAAKYYARATIMHRSLNVIPSSLMWGPREQVYNLFKNINTIMGGAEPVSLPIEIQSEAENIRSYSFSLSSGDKLIALWTDGVAVDEDPGVEAHLFLPDFSAQEVTGIDVLTGYQQSITASNENGDLLIENLIVRDYPLILHITESS